MSKRTSSVNKSEESGSKEEEAKKLKIGFNLDKKSTFSLAGKKGIQIKLPSQKDNATTSLKPPSRTVASVFGEESDEEPEEMPPEAKMRMRNIGRDTPTSAGPNSYGKTKQGFCNAKKVFEKTLKEAALECSDDKPKSKVKY